MNTLPDGTSPHYIAFLSYAHKDEKWAYWLHTKLEQFKIDKDLVGVATERGVVPKNLRPIFLDRGNFAGGDTLHEATLMALSGSAALIVLCSTVAAERPAVNEEVRMFKQLHPDRPIIPVLIEGTAPHNFPRALLYELNADGSVSDQRVTVLGPDLRESADGKQLGLAKVVAGLLGFSNADNIYQRAERHRLQQQRIKRGLAIAGIILVTVGGYFGWANLQKKLLLARAYEAASKYSDFSLSEGGSPDASQLKNLIVQIAEGAATDPRKAKAIRQLNNDDPDGAAETLKEIALDAKKRINNQKKGVASAYREYATIAGLADPKRARGAFDEALSFDPKDRQSLYGRGWLSLLASFVTEAKRDLEELLTQANSEDDKQHQYLAHIRLGEVAKARGDLVTAKSHQNKALAITEKKISALGKDAGWMRYRSFSLEKLGDLLVEGRALDAAAENFRNPLAIRQTLHSEALEDKSKQRELAVAYEKTGDVFLMKRDFAEASKSYNRAFDLREKLYDAEPKKPGWQRALALSHERLARLHMERSQGNEALKHAQGALRLREPLAKQDSGNDTWRRDLSVSHEQVGEAQTMLGKPKEALSAHQNALSIRQALSKKDPSNAVWKRDLAVSHSKIGNLLCHEDNYTTGLPHLKTSQKLYQDLAKLDNEGIASLRAQIDLVRAYVLRAKYLPEQGQFDEALALLKIARDIVVPHTKQSDRGPWPELLNSISWQIESLEE